MRYEKSLVHSAFVDRVMSEYGLTRWCDLDAAFGVNKANKLLGELAEKSDIVGMTRSSAGFGLSSLAIEEGLYSGFELPSPVRKRNLHYRTASYLSADPRGKLAEFFADRVADAPDVNDVLHSEEFLTKYPDIEDARKGLVRAMQYIIRDYPEKVNWEFIDLWCAKHPFYAWAVYSAHGEMYPEDGPMTPFFELDGRERTVLLSDAGVINALWEQPRSHCVEICQYDSTTRGEGLADYQRGPSVPACFMERMLVCDSSNRVMDLLLIQRWGGHLYNPDGSGAKTAHEGCGVLSALLFVHRRDSAYPPIMYYHIYTCNVLGFSLTEILNECRAKLSAFVEQKTGLSFVDNTKNIQPGSVSPAVSCGVFPQLYPGVTKLSDSIKSNVCIGRDVVAPSYIVCTDGAVSCLSTTARERLGTVVSFLSHNQIGFGGEFVRKFITMDRRECGDADVDIRIYITKALSGIKLLEFAEKEYDENNSVEIMSSIGMATKTVEDDSIYIDFSKEVPTFRISEKAPTYELVCRSCKTPTWEPENSVPVSLEDLRDVMATLVAADETDGFPERFWVMSQSDRWYEYSYENAPSKLDIAELGRMKVRGIVDASTVHSAATRAFVLCECNLWKNTNPEGVAKIKKIHLVSHNYYGEGALIRQNVKGVHLVADGRRRSLSMRNDVRPIWRFLTSDACKDWFERM